MKIASLASHLHGRLIIEQAFATEWDELRGAVEEAGLPLNLTEPFTATGRPPTPKRHSRRYGGREAQALLPIDQRALNEKIREGLRRRGWETYPLVLGRASEAPPVLQLRGDFAKRGVFVEVEFGNTASLYRNLFKFHVAGMSRVAEVGVMIVARAEVGRLFDDGVTTFETLERLEPYMRAGLSIPVLVAGLDVPDWDAVRTHYAKMQKIAEANGIRCHDLDTVRRTPEPTAELEE